MKNKTLRDVTTLLVGVIIGGLLAFVPAHANPIDDNCPDHVTWGAPQIAKEGDNQYICRLQYAVNYSYRTKVAHFVVERVEKAELVKETHRKDDFREDKDVPEKYRATLEDYAKSGYDRGHIAPAADFSFSKEAMSESFFLTNMMPQDPGNNRGIWKLTESYVRQWAEKYGEVYVISGPYYSPKATKSIGNGVLVPDFVWKIVIDKKRGKSIAFLFPNEKLSKDKLADYITSIDKIEELTKIDFSPALPKDMDKLESAVGNLKDW